MLRGILHTGTLEMLSSVEINRELSHLIIRTALAVIAAN